MPLDYLNSDLSSAKFVFVCEGVNSVQKSRMPELSCFDRTISRSIDRWKLNCNVTRIVLKPYAPALLLFLQVFIKMSLFQTTTQA